MCNTAERGQAMFYTSCIQLQTSIHLSGFDRLRVNVTPPMVHVYICFLAIQHVQQEKNMRSFFRKDSVVYATLENHNMCKN